MGRLISAVQDATSARTASAIQRSKAVGGLLTGLEHLAETGEEADRYKKVDHYPIATA